MSQDRRKRLGFVATFVAVGTAALVLSLEAPLREAAAVILMVPLIWAYMTRGLRGMAVSAVIVTLLRTAVEIIQSSRADSLTFLHVGREVFFPFLLYFGLAIPFYLYRRKQQSLLLRLAEVGEQEVRDRLASGLTHDFQNVLSLIVGTADRLLQSRTLDTPAVQDVNSILVLARQGRELIRQTRRNASPAAPAGADPPTVLCDLNDVVERQMELIARTLEPQTRLEQRFSPEPLPVRLDVAGLLRVLINLSLNARQAMPRGGVLRIETSVQSQSAAAAALSVSDTGTGMDDQALSHLFEPFFTTHGDHGQVGMGLSIVQSVVKTHGGSVAVRSAPGQGTTVTILLPLARTRLPQCAVA